MKKFWLFCGENYYEPEGGLSDFYKDFDDFEDAKKEAESFISFKGACSWSKIYLFDEKINKEPLFSVKG